MTSEQALELQLAEEQHEQAKAALEEAKESIRQAGKAAGRRKKELEEAGQYRDAVIRWATGKVSVRPVRQQKLDLEGQDRGDSAPVGVLHVLGRAPKALTDRLIEKGIDTIGAVKDAMKSGGGRLPGFLPAEDAAIVESIATRRRALDRAGE